MSMLMRLWHEVRVTGVVVGLELVNSMFTSRLSLGVEMEKF